MQNKHTSLASLTESHADAVRDKREAMNLAPPTSPFCEDGKALLLQGSQVSRQVASSQPRGAVTYLECGWYGHGPEFLLRFLN